MLLSAFALLTFAFLHCLGPATDGPMSMLTPHFQSSWREPAFKAVKAVYSGSPPDSNAKLETQNADHFSLNAELDNHVMEFSVRDAELSSRDGDTMIYTKNPSPFSPNVPRQPRKFCRPTPTLRFSEFCLSNRYTSLSIDPVTGRIETLRGCLTGECGGELKDALAGGIGLEVRKRARQGFWDNLKDARDKNCTC